MINISRKINKNYAWELVFFNKIRNFSDGFIFLEIKCNWDKYLSDHSPRLEIYYIALNYMIFEFNIYYLYHREK